MSKIAVNPDLNRYMEKDIEPYLAGCYVIIFDNILYLYIGSTTNLVDKGKYLTNNIRKIIKNIPSKPKRCNTNIERFIESEITHNGFLTYNILPVYFCCNYLNKFKSLYPEYKLSKGEFILLSSITDLTIKILEKSLITYFKPKLNKLNYAEIKPLIWCDSYLDEYCYKDPSPSYKSLYKKYDK